MTTTPRRTVVLLAGLLSVTACLVPLITGVEALPTHRSYKVWYENTDFTGWNGEKTVECDGTITVQGTLNGNSRTEEYESCGSTNFYMLCYEKDMSGQWHAAACPQ